MEVVAQAKNGGYLIRATEAETQKLLQTTTPQLGDTFDLAQFVQKLNWLSANVGKLNTYADNLEGFASQMRAAANSL